MPPSSSRPYKKQEKQMQDGKLRQAAFSILAASALRKGKVAPGSAGEGNGPLHLQRPLVGRFSVLTQNPFPSQHVSDTEHNSVKGAQADGGMAVWEALCQLTVCSVALQGF